MITTKKLSKILFIVLIAGVIIGAVWFNHDEYADGSLPLYQQNQATELFLGTLNSYVSEEEKENIALLVANWMQCYDQRMKFGWFFTEDAETEALMTLNDALDELTIAYLYDSDYEEYPNPEYTNSIIENIKNIISQEDYDELYRICMELQEQGDTIDIDELYDQLFNILEKYPDLDADTLSYYMTCFEGSLLAVYDLDQSGSLSPTTIKYVTLDGADERITTTYPKIWEEAKNILPANSFSDFSTLMFETDGEFDELAYVWDDDGDGKSWIICIDPADVDGVLFQETIIHEYCHYLTLNAQQGRYTETGSRFTYYDGYFQSFEQSYLNKFNESFWGILSEEASLGVDTELFFMRHEDLFVSEYAATNVEEDICESFAAYVLGGTLPSSELELSKVKYDFFDSYHEFRELKKQINVSIGLAAQS